MGDQVPAVRRAWQVAHAGGEWVNMRWPEARVQCASAASSAYSSSASDHSYSLTTVVGLFGLTSFGAKERNEFTLSMADLLDVEQDDIELGQIGTSAEAAG